MKRYSTLLIVFCPALSFAQNIGINTTGLAPAATNMLEVLQPSTTTNTIGIYSRHSGNTAGNTYYGFQAIADGTAGLAHIAAYLSASGATNNYALIVPSSGGKVGIGLTAPTMLLDVTSATTTVGESSIRGASTGNAAVYGMQGSITSITNTAAGVYGSSSGATGQTFGVLGINTSTTANAAGVRGFASGATGATFGVWGENASSISDAAGVYGSASTTTNGTSWAAPIAGVMGKAGTNPSQFHAGVYGFQIGSGNNSGGVVGAFSSAIWGGLGYTDGAGSSFGGFFNGNARATGYLLVGNPVAPSSTASSSTQVFYSSSLDAGAAGWSQTLVCGAAATAWTFSFTSNNGVLTYNNSGARSFNYLYSPVIWIPAGVTSITEEGHFSCTLEDSFDGVYLEYSLNGGAWTKITVFSIGAYNDALVEGSNTICTADDIQSAWTAGFPGPFNGPFRCAVGTAGNWIRFRFVGREDGADATGQFDLYGFSVGGILPATVGGPFATGNIYAEKNVYAGSNALVGDVAEYFKVDVHTEPGDLIAMKSYTGDEYTISVQAYNPYVIGIHSTNPTVTLNQPSGAPVCLTGRVPVKVCGENGTIQIGDYLTSASLKGYAMKAAKSCFIIGRALANFEEKGTGKILCMVETGWYNPANNYNQSGGRFFIKNDNTSVIVNDASVKEDSRIFITLRDNAGGHWISNVSEGSFTVNISKSSKKNIPFDYFIDNTISPTSDSRGISVRDDEKKTIKETTAGKSTNETTTIKKTTLPEYTGEMPPGDPPNSENGWIWSKATGYIMTKDLSAINPKTPNEKK